MGNDFSPHFWPFWGFFASMGIFVGIKTEMGILGIFGNFQKIAKTPHFDGFSGDFRQVYDHLVPQKVGKRIATFKMN